MWNGWMLNKEAAGVAVLVLVYFIFLGSLMTLY